MDTKSIINKLEGVNERLKNTQIVKAGVISFIKFIVRKYLGGALVFIILYLSAHPNNFIMRFLHDALMKIIIH